MVETRLTTMNLSWQTPLAAFGRPGVPIWVLCLRSLPEWTT